MWDVEGKQVWSLRHEHIKKSCFRIKKKFRIKQKLFEWVLLVLLVCGARGLLVLWSLASSSSLLCSPFRFPLSHRDRYQGTKPCLLSVPDSILLIRFAFFYPSMDRNTRTQSRVSGSCCSPNDCFIFWGKAFFISKYLVWSCTGSNHCEPSKFAWDIKLLSPSQFDIIKLCCQHAV